VREALYGRTLEEVLDGRKLLVTYDILNRMMPPGTMPADPSLSVTVLFEIAVHPGIDIDLGFGLGFENDFAALVTPEYRSFTGVVTDITTNLNDMPRIRVEYGEYGIMDFNVDHLTHIVGAEIQIGDTVKGFYDTSVPVIMIWPPQYTARVLVNAPQDGVDTAIVVNNQDFVLDITDATPIHFADGINVREALYGRTLEEVLNNRTLLITSDAEGIKSVVVLFERAVHLPGLGLDIDPLDPGYGYAIEWEYNYGISVNDRMLDTLWHYQDGGFFVPFRAVVNMLGYGNTIEWLAETREVTVFNGTHDIRIAIDSGRFMVGDVEMVLSHPAILVGSLTYVPFRFFSDVFGVSNAWMSAGQIFIDNIHEPMH